MPHSIDCQLTVSRKSPDDAKQRQIIVKLDGETIAELMFGDEITHTVAPGRHRLQVDNTWNWKTIEFDAAPGEHVKFVTVSRVGRFTWFIVAVLGAGPMYVSVERAKQACYDA